MDKMKDINFTKDLQYKKFCAYGFLKNLRFFEPFILLYFRSKGFSFFQIGVLYTVREISSNLFEIPTGILADVFGRRKSMIFSFINYIMSFLLFYLTNNLLFFIGGMILFGLGEAFRSGTHKAMILTYLKINNMESSKVNYYGHTRSWSQKGSALSALIAAGLVFYTGNYEYIFLFSIIPYLLDLGLMLTYPIQLDGNIKKLKEISFLPAIREGVTNFTSLTKDKKILKAIFNGSVFSGFYKAVKDYIQPLIALFAVSLPFSSNIPENKKLAIMTGVIYFLLYYLTSISSKNAGKITQKFSDIALPLNITLIIGFTFGILIGVFSFMNFVLFSIIMFVIIAIIQNLRRPMIVSSVSDLIPKNSLASALSFESQITSLIAGILALIIGFLADYFGPDLAISIISIIFIILSPLYFIRGKIVDK